MVFDLRFVPRKRFKWNKMVFALWFVLFERISGTIPFARDIPYRLNVLSGTELVSSCVLSYLNVLDGTKQ